jgi:Tol biopolymer transport system component
MVVFEMNMKRYIRLLILSICPVLNCCNPGTEGVIKRNDNAFRVGINLNGSLQNPAWSPDGEHLLFTRFRKGYNEEPADLYIVDLNTSTVTQLVADGSGNVNLPGSVWNSTGNTIVFSSSRDPHDEIFGINADREHQR